VLGGSAGPTAEGAGAPALANRPGCAPAPAAPPQIPKVYTHYAATILFFFFGFKTLYDVLYNHNEVSRTGEQEAQGRAGTARHAQRAWRAAPAAAVHPLHATAWRPPDSHPLPAARAGRGKRTAASGAGIEYQRGGGRAAGQGIQ